MCLQIKFFSTLAANFYLLILINWYKLSVFNTVCAFVALWEIVLRLEWYSVTLNLWQGKVNQT